MTSDAVLGSRAPASGVAGMAGDGLSPAPRRSPVSGVPCWARIGPAARTAAARMRGYRRIFTPGIVGRELGHHNGKLPCGVKRRGLEWSFPQEFGGEAM